MYQSTPGGLIYLNRSRVWLFGSVLRNAVRSGHLFSAADIWPPGRRTSMGHVPIDSPWSNTYELTPSLTFWVSVSKYQPFWPFIFGLLYLATGSSDIDGTCTNRLPLFYYI